MVGVAAVLTLALPVASCGSVLFGDSVGEPCAIAHGLSHNLAAVLATLGAGLYVAARWDN